MSGSLAVAINVVLDTAIVLAILLLLGWGIVMGRRDARRWAFTERRRGVDRRRGRGRVAAHGERRRGERRVPRPIPSV